MTEIPLRLLLSFLPAVAALLTSLAVALAEKDPLAAVDGRFLTVAGAFGLLAVAWLAPRLAIPVSFLFVVAFLGQSAGPIRSFSLTTLLLIALLVAFHRRFAGRIELAPTFVFLLGAQALLRPDLLLLARFGWRELVLLLCLPGLAAAALWALGRRFAPERALLLGVATLLIGQGLDLKGTILLLCLALGAQALDGAGKAQKLALGLLLIAPILWRWPELLATSAAGLCLLLESRVPRLALAPPLLVLILVSTPTSQPVGAPLTFFFLACAWVPAALMAEGRDRLRLGCGVFLVLAGGWLGSDFRLALPGLALLILATPVERAIGQRLWVLGLGLPVALMALFPWQRPAPFVAVLEFWQVSAGVLALVAFTFVLVNERLLPMLWPTAAAPRRRAVAVALAALTVAGLTARILPLPATALLAGPLAALSSDRPLLELAVEVRPVRRVVVDTALIDGVHLPAGQEVAQVQLFDARGALIYSWPLRVGDDTSDWAALRDDVKSRPGFRAPAHFSLGIAPDGRVFSARFRAHFFPAKPANAARLVIRRSNLTDNTLVLVHNVEVGP